MSRLLRSVRRLGAFIGKPRLDADLDAELAAHLEMAIEDNLARGLSLCRGAPSGPDQHRRNTTSSGEAKGGARTDDTRHSGTGHSLHAAHTGPRSRIHIRCDPDSRAGHRRQHRRFQRGEYAAAAAAALSQSPATGVDSPAAGQVRSVLRNVFDRCLRRVSREYPLIPGRDRILRLLQPR